MGQPARKRAGQAGRDSPELKLSAKDAETLTDAPPPKVIIERLLEIRELAAAAGKPISLQQMANAIGIHYGSLSRILNPATTRHRDMSEDVRLKAWTYIRLMEMAEEDTDVGRTVPTTVTRRVAKLCAYCQAERCMGMLVSETSAGKTVSLLAYAEANPASIYVKASGAGTNSISGMVDAVWRGSGFRDTGAGPRRVVPQKWAAILRGLKTPGVSARLILVDDAHTLNFSVLEVLREIHDETGVGIVLAGTTRLADRVTLSGDAHQMYEQIRARIQIVRNIGKPTPDDVAAVAAAWAPERARFTPAALEYLHRLSQGLGALRVVKAHVRMALRLRGANRVNWKRQAIDVIHLQKAHTQLTDQRSRLAGG